MVETSSRKKVAMLVLLHSLVPVVLSAVISIALLTSVQSLSKVPPGAVFATVFAVVFYFYSLLVWSKKQNTLFYILTVVAFGIGGYAVTGGVWWGILIGCAIWLGLSLALGYTMKGFRSLVPKISRKSKSDYVSQGAAHDSLPGIQANTGSVDVLAEFHDPTSGKRVVINTNDLVDQQSMANKIRLAEQLGFHGQLAVQLLESMSKLVDKGIIDQAQFQNWLLKKFPEMELRVEAPTKRVRRADPDFMIPL